MCCMPATYPVALAKHPAVSAFYRLLYACNTSHEICKKVQVCFADYMLVMELEGDNVAHKLHQQVKCIHYSCLL